MVYSNIKRILLILLCIFVLIFPFWCVAGLCVETETVDFDTVLGIKIAQNVNYFTDQDVASGVGVGYFIAEKGYIYHITNNSSSLRFLATSSGVPVANGTYQFLTTLNRGDIYSYISNSNETLYFDFSSYQSVSVTREKISSMDGAVNDLVNNVGPDAIWNIFNNGVNYIYVVVFVSFGIFIITLVIRKISKGKEGF